MSQFLTSLVPQRLKRNSRIESLDVSQADKGKGVLRSGAHSPSSREHRIEFYSRDMPSFWLSNSSEHAVVFDGVRYPTAEHLFQALKFIDDHPEIAAKVRKASTPLEAMRIARSHSQSVRADWISDGVNVIQMRMVLLMKFSQHSDLFLALLETGDAEIVHASPNDAFWGSGAHAGESGNGRNVLGRTLVQTRELLRVAAGVGPGSGVSISGPSDYSVAPENGSPVTHAVIVGRELPNELPSSVLEVPVDNEADAPIYIFFGRVRAFIQDALAAHGTVTIYAQDSGRSATVAAAYLMTTGAPLDDAIKAAAANEGGPNAGFLRQLELFAQERCRVQLQSPPVRRFLLSHTCVLDGYVDRGVLFSAYPDPAGQDEFSDPPDETAADSHTAGTRLRCKMCRQELALEQHVVQHAPGKGELSFEPHKRDSVRHGLDSGAIGRQKGSGVAQPAAAPAALPPQLARVLAMRAAPTRSPLLPSASCSAYFVEPLKWMTETSDVVEGVLCGRLICPNQRCSAKLGSWTWAGTQCGCGAWVTPAFALQRAKVDEVR
ncbi:hypothetical protein MCUN1_002034 [Malassezia cuniculi]|uniref:protein-tyrosine-phosphatase n=1 Tax=Malassezia cuniculi TaxID=948313 RepID=A0AAF0EU54_9BASI|nr:hypothetical protein MCUN1_002034 [Malassezia cuniculi]